MIYLVSFTQKSEITKIPIIVKNHWQQFILLRIKSKQTQETLQLIELKRGAEVILIINV